MDQYSGEEVTKLLIGNKDDVKGDKVIDPEQAMPRRESGRRGGRGGERKQGGGEGDSETETETET